MKLKILSQCKISSKEAKSLSPITGQEPAWSCLGTEVPPQPGWAVGRRLFGSRGHWEAGTRLRFQKRLVYPPPPPPHNFPVQQKLPSVSSDKSLGSPLMSRRHFSLGIARHARVCRKLDQDVTEFIHTNAVFSFKEELFLFSLLCPQTSALPLSRPGSLHSAKDFSSVFSTTGAAGEQGVPILDAMVVPGFAWTLQSLHDACVVISVYCRNTLLKQNPLYHQIGKYVE